MARERVRYGHLNANHRLHLVTRTDAVHNCERGIEQRLADSAVAALKGLQQPAYFRIDKIRRRGAKRIHDPGLPSLAAVDRLQVDVAGLGLFESNSNAGTSPLAARRFSRGRRSN